MAKPTDPAVDVIREGLRSAWEALRQEHPTEQVYAFGVYTTEGAEFMMPFACGEEGLRRVAEKYVKKGAVYKTVEDGLAGLRWSIADSPYGEFFGKGDVELDKAFEGLENPLDLPETKMVREVHRRLSAAAEALKALDAEGVFGTGKARENVTILIEAGDREQEWAEKWARKLNPAKVYKAWATPPVETVGRFTEFGTKKVYTTEKLALSGDRSLIAAATQDMFFVFSTQPLKQLVGRGFTGELKHRSIKQIGLSADGAAIAVHVDGMNGKPGNLVWETGPAWKTEKPVPLPARGMSLEMAPKGTWAAVGDDRGQIQIHARDGGSPRILKGHNKWVRCLSVTADGRHLASVDGEALVVWNTATWEPILKIEDEGDSVHLSAEGQWVISTKRFGRLDRPKQGDRAALARIRDAKSGKVVRDVEVPGHSISTSKFSPDGTMLACAVTRLPTAEERYVSGSEAVLLEVATGKIHARLKVDFERINDFEFLPERGEIAVAVFGHTRRPLVLWQIPAKDQLAHSVATGNMRRTP